MPKNTPERIIDADRKPGGIIIAYAGSSGGGGGGVTDHGALTGLLDDDHPQYYNQARGDARYVPLTRQVTTGAAIMGGGPLSSDVSIAVNPSIAGAGLAWAAGVMSVGQGLGLLINADDVQVNPSIAGAGLAWASGVLNIGVANTGPATGLTVEADQLRLTASSDPGQSAMIVATDAAGATTFRNLFALQGVASSSPVFASGFAGSGWRVDYGLTTASRASMETDDLTVRGRMRVYELLIQQIRATNGSLFVSSASKVVSVTAVTDPNWTVNGTQLTFNGVNATFSTTIYTISTAAAGDTSRELYHGFLAGDIIRAQRVQWDGSQFAGIIQSNLEVTGAGSLYSYDAAYVSGDAPAVGYDFVRLGNSVDMSRQGAVYITSDDSAAPFIDIVDGIRSHDDWNSAAVRRVRVGKLSGISDPAFGGPLGGYGLYGNNVYLRGQIVVTGGSLGGLAAADVNANVTTIDGGHITANTVTADRINVNNLSAIKADLGSVTAGQIVVGSTNKLWLNDSADGQLAIGGTVKGSAPFRVSAAGHLDAIDASFGTMKVDANGAFIDAPGIWNSAYGYKFRWSSMFVGGLLTYHNAGATGQLDLCINASSANDNAVVSGIDTSLTLRVNAAGTDKIPQIVLRAASQSRGTFAQLRLTDYSAGGGTALERSVIFDVDVAYINNSAGTKAMLHQGMYGHGGGINADQVDGYEASALAKRAGDTFSGDTSFSAAINAGTYIRFQPYNIGGGASEPGADAGYVILYATRSGNTMKLKTRGKSPDGTQTFDVTIATT